MVKATGEEYYAVSSEFDTHYVTSNAWLRENVWSQLPTFPGDVLDLAHPQVKTRAQIAAEVRAFVLSHPDPQLCAYFGAYDHVVLCQLFGSMVDLPDGFPKFTFDLKQRMTEKGLKKEHLPEQETGNHNALHDARWVRTASYYLDGLFPD